MEECLCVSRVRDVNGTASDVDSVSSGQFSSCANFPSGHVGSVRACVANSSLCYLSLNLYIKVKETAFYN